MQHGITSDSSQEHMRSEYLTPEDVRSELGLSMPTIYRALAKGQLPGAQFGNRWRIRRSDFDALFSHKERPAG